MIKYTEPIIFIIPWLEEFKSNPLSEMIDKYRDQSLMAARLFHACSIKGIPTTNHFPSASAKGMYFLYDYFLNRKFDGSFFYFDYKKLELQDNIKIICECSEIETRVHKQPCFLQFNPFICNYLKQFDDQNFYRSNLINKFNNFKEICVPLGSISELCQKKFHSNKTIFLDEPHSWTVKKISKGRKLFLHPINNEDQDVYSYFKAIEICQILQSRGFTINTFASRSNWDNKNLNFNTENKFWIPYQEMLQKYARASMFFCHYQETHGFSVFDNLQMGNAVIVFEENYNPFILNQFQNGVKLSLRMKSEICADLVQEYHEHVYKEDIFHKIKDDAYVNFSTDTFVDRLIKCLDLKKPLKC